jgi:hypothetical protein
MIVDGNDDDEFSVFGLNCMRQTVFVCVNCASRIACSPMRVKLTRQLCGFDC